MNEAALVRPAEGANAGLKAFMVGDGELSACDVGLREGVAAGNDSFQDNGNGIV